MIPERFIQMIKIADTGCWEWQGNKSTDGYGCWSGKRVHRCLYSVQHGPIPDGLIIMHRCDNRSCCNPAHLELGTVADNNKDMMLKGRASNQHKGKTHCKNGHEYTPENTYKYGKMRVCKTCSIARVNKQRASQQPQVNP